MSSPTNAESQPPAEISPFLPAAILESAGIKLCIVGNAAVIHFGSDLLLADLDLAIADEQFDLALSILHNEGFCDIDFSSCQLTSMPVVGGPGGWVAHRLQHPPSLYKVMLYPASCWHLDINADTNFPPHPDPYRFPSFLVYLEALINTIDALVSVGDNSLHFRYLYASMVILLGRRPEPRGMIPPGDQFFMDFYMKQNARSGKLRVLELRRGIIAGTMSVDSARAVVPRPDLSIRGIKERQLRQRLRGENTEGMAGEDGDASVHVT